MCHPAILRGGLGVGGGASPNNITFCADKPGLPRTAVAAHLGGKRTTLSWAALCLAGKLKSERSADLGKHLDWSRTSDNRSQDNASAKASPQATQKHHSSLRRPKLLSYH